MFVGELKIDSEKWTNDTLTPCPRLTGKLFLASEVSISTISHHPPFILPMDSMAMAKPITEYVLSNGIVGRCGTAKLPANGPDSNANARHVHRVGGRVCPNGAHRKKVTLAVGLRCVSVNRRFNYLDMGLGGCLFPAAGERKAPPLLLPFCSVKGVPFLTHKPTLTHGRVFLSLSRVLSCEVK